MPYDLDNPPDKLRGLSADKQRQWIHVHRSCVEKYGDSVRCQKMAWGVTGGWKGKDFNEYDEDRDLLIEFEQANIEEEKNRIEQELGFEIDFL